jgi:hypothetical protein
VLEDIQLNAVQVASILRCSFQTSRSRVSMPCVRNMWERSMKACWPVGDVAFGLKTGRGEYVEAGRSTRQRVLSSCANPLYDLPTPRRLLGGSVTFLDRRGCPSLKEGIFCLASRLTLATSTMSSDVAQIVSTGLPPAAMSATIGISSRRPQTVRIGVRARKCASRNLRKSERPRRLHSAFP